MKTEEKSREMKKRSWEKKIKGTGKRNRDSRRVRRREMKAREEEREINDEHIALEMKERKGEEGERGRGRR